MGPIPTQHNHIYKLQIRRITTALRQQACSHFDQLVSGELSPSTIAAMKAEDFLSDQVVHRPQRRPSVHVACPSPS